MKLVAELDDLAPLNRFLRETDIDTATTLIRRFDDPETLRRFFELDVEDVDMVSWRRNLARNVADSKEVTGTDVEGYVEEILEVRRLSKQTVSGTDDPVVENVAGLMAEIADNPAPSQFVGQQLEAHRALHFGRRAVDPDSSVRRVVVEPVDEIDLEVEFQGGRESFIESKNPEGELDTRRIRRGIESATGSWRKAESRNPDFEIGGSDSRILTFGTRRRGVSTEGKLSSRSDIRDVVEQALRDSFPTPSDADFDTVRIVFQNDDRLEIDVDDAFGDD